MKRLKFVIAMLALLAASSGCTKPSSGGAAATVSPVEKGRDLYQSKGCVACHSIDGTRKVGPTWKGIWGKEEELVGGAKVVVDEKYVRESILDPAAKVVKGYSPNMPSFKGLLSDEEIDALTSFIKSLKEN